MKKHVVILAAGSGERMHSKTPKQFLNLNGKPILFYSIEAFYKAFSDINVLLVISKNHQFHLQELLKEYAFEYKFDIVEGGKTRFKSVKNALKKIEGNGLVAIHDGVRPFIKPKWIKQIFKKASQYGSAVPVIDTKESLILLNNKGVKTAKRENFKTAQTPQCFDIQSIKEAYHQTFRKKFTDDASVLMSKKNKIFLIKGLEKNIKITTPLDLKIAHEIAGKKSSNKRNVGKN